MLGWAGLWVLLTGSLITVSLADEVVPGEGEALVARAAMLVVSMDAIAMEKRMAAMNARRLCLRGMLFLFFLICR